LGCNNSWIIDNLPNGIKKLTLLWDFKLPLDNLPNEIKRIIFNKDNYNKKLNSLPEFIEYIKLPLYYKFPIDNLPKNLLTIECPDN